MEIVRPNPITEAEGLNAMSDKIELQLPGGRISASVQDGIVRARGIRYATANRFEPPFPLESWDEVMDCTKPAPICPQDVPSRLDHTTGEITKGYAQDEDCFHVTVTVSLDTLNSKRKRAVMVYLHGGAHVSGGSDIDAYSPVGLAAKGVVAVNLSYRLGIFGYCPIPGWSPANLGVRDQIAALEWVQRNIEAFGGDPDNVTLFGQSAGGDSIYCLMIADGTEHLFHKAILQSAPIGVRHLNREPMLQALGDLARDRLDADKLPRTTEEMLALQAELREAAKPYPSWLMAFGPSQGHAPLPPHSEIPKRLKDAAQRIPIMIGYTKDEGSPFVQMMEHLRTPFSIPLFGRLCKSFVEWWLSVTTFNWPSIRMHKAYLAAGGSSRLYRFNWAPRKSPLRSAHCLELPFLLGTSSGWDEAPMMYGSTHDEVVLRLADRMKNIWVAFARGRGANTGVFDIVGNQTRADIVFRKSI